MYTKRILKSCDCSHRMFQTRFWTPKGHCTFTAVPYMHRALSFPRFFIRRDLRLPHFQGFDTPKETPHDCNYSVVPEKTLVLPEKLPKKRLNFQSSSDRPRRRIPRAQDFQDLTGSPPPSSGFPRFPRFSNLISKLFYTTSYKKQCK